VYISSDTNVWLDFQAIGCLFHPFLLDHAYFISDVTLHDEVLRPPILQTALLGHVSLLAGKYPRISRYDALALSIAMTRGWMLLSGDKALRNAAEAESVVCRGTIWVYDELLALGRISKADYAKAMEDLLKAVEQGKCRLPRTELESRMKRLDVSP